ncbi:MAG: hypothetical protein L3J84_01990 [Gammaproteobacteria bacterium]|nr:hypothetical protein [Gammaproteobacteria bacterium]
MKNTLISFIAILFIASCSTTHKVPSVLFQTYSKYKESTNENNIKEVASVYFSQSLLGKNYRTNSDAIRQLLFKDYMISIVNHHEQVKFQNGCLTINGYDEESAPLIFSLKYLLKDGRWLIDKIHVVFIESKNDFNQEAKCPKSYIN